MKFVDKLTNISIRVIVFFYEFTHFGADRKVTENFDLLMVVDLQYLMLCTEFILVINQLDAQNFCFTVSLFHASTCFEHMCSSSGGQNCIIQHLVSSHL